MLRFTAVRCGHYALLQLDVSMRQDNEKHFFLLEVLLNLPELTSY